MWDLLYFPVRKKQFEMIMILIIKYSLFIKILEIVHSSGSATVVEVVDIYYICVDGNMFSLAVLVTLIKLRAVYEI